MSLYGALFSGVSGLNAQSTKLSVISDNISNVNTVGYKGGSAQFESLVTGASSSTSYSPGGVIGGNRQLIDQQGLLQSTSSPTDIAIQGSGFFVVNGSPTGSGQVLFTRSGSFIQDSTGNFVNSSGFYLQAWPLDRNGNLPGSPGNPDTTSSANLNSLKTVNVQNVTGAAASTTSVSVGANLDAGKSNYPGAGVTGSLDRLDSNNYNLNASQILVPTLTDSLTKGDAFTVTTGSSLSYSYNYGGYTYSRDISATGSSTDYGDSNAANPVAITIADQALSFTAGSRTVTITTSSLPADVVQGAVVKFAGDTTALNGLAANTLNGNFYVQSVSGNTFTIALPTTLPAPAAQAVTADSMIGNNGDTWITINQDPPAGLLIGDTVTIASATHLVDGSSAEVLSAANLNGNRTVRAVGAHSYEINVGAALSASSVTGGGSAATMFVKTGSSHAATFDTNLFSGNILDATTPTQPLLTNASLYTTAAQSFSISTPTIGTKTFTYQAASPNAQSLQFSSINQLADAINTVSGLTARVVNHRLYISSIDANDSITFTNGSTTGSNTSPAALAGIDWKGELGLANVGLGSNRFSTMQGLADLVNNSSGLSATVSSPTANSSLTINVDDPLDTVNFTDGSTTVTNTGSLLGQLGFTASLNGASIPVTPPSTGDLGPAYDPSDPTKNMASGAITPQFSRPVSVFDSLGTQHNMNIAFIKLSTVPGTWAVEVYAEPASEVNSSLPNGQVAFGNIVFNGDGTLRSVSPTLNNTTPAIINWTNGATANDVTFNWGTPGQIAGTPNAIIGKTDGLSQFDSDFSVNFVKQNGTPVGDLTGVSIDADGFITASFSNGETQKLYKIPLAKFPDADGLQAVTGNVFAQTSGSGEVNLTQAGTNNVGTIASQSLEASNVELANQLTDMIVAQRAYQANTKVISTADTLLDDLDQILR